MGGLEHSGGSGVPRSGQADTGPIVGSRGAGAGLNVVLGLLGPVGMELKEERAQTMKSFDISGGKGTMDGITRRRFLAGATAAVAAPYVMPATSLGAGGATAPSERIGLGFIGMGSRGSSHVRSLAGNEQVQILAVCDANKPKADANLAKAGNGCKSYSDFREVLAREDIDAVVIASPENWHALMAARAAEAGKDVYCEKALSLTVKEGRQLCKTVRRYGTVFQIGTQQRSDQKFRFACELARNGYLGKLKRVEVGVPGGRALPEAPAAPVPEGLDYDLWLGPAPFTPYNKLKCSFNWYFIFDYCAGWIQSWGVHHCDIALWGAPSLMADKLQVEGKATFPTAGIANTSITWNLQYTTPSGLVFSFTDNKVHPQGCKFIGDKGWVHVRRGGIKAEPVSLLKTAIKPDEEHLYESSNHHGNFLGCIKTRRDPVAAVEGGHAATTITLVGDIATRLGRKLTWDWKAEKFVNDEAANRMLSRSMRTPWSM